MVEIKNIEISPVEVGAKPEQYPEAEARAAEKVRPAETAPVATPVIDLAQNTPVPAVADETIVLQKVENILAQNLDNVFLTMDAMAQARFKAAGETTAHEISSLFQKGKATAKNIISLIINWLRLIPKVNRHFLEQEAKIKADAILKLYNRQ